MGEVATRDFIRGELQRMLEELQEEQARRPESPRPETT
jgi:hypothetical protein